MSGNTILANASLSEQATRLDSPTPPRRLIAAGIKRGPAAWLVEQPPMSQADVDCHAAASLVRTPVGA